MAFVDLIDRRWSLYRRKYLYYRWNDNWSSNTVDTLVRVFLSLRLQKGNILRGYEAFS